MHAKIPINIKGLFPDDFSFRGRGVHRAFIWFVFIYLIVCESGCAKIGKPTGGPKDSDPPVYLSGDPENRSVMVETKEANLYFNEFLQLKDLNRELVISPPLKERPSVRTRDRGIRIVINDELADRTTYTFNFGNAITDLNEGNILADFEYVISTGPEIDSLAVAGKVVWAQNLLPAEKEEVFILVYSNLADSAVYKEIPGFIGKAGINGLYSVNNLPSGTFRILALADRDGNRIYSPGNDAIAFLDSFAVLDGRTVKPVQFIKDTLQSKATNPRNKSEKNAGMPASADSSRLQGRRLNALFADMFLFEEEEQTVRILKHIRPVAEQLVFVFNRPLHDSVSIEPINFVMTPEDWLLEQSVSRDTVVLWIADSLIYNKDTLMLSLAYNTADSLNQLVTVRDTLRLLHQVTGSKPVRERKPTGPAGPEVKSFLALSSSVQSGKTIDLNRDLLFTAGKPINQMRADSFVLVRQLDSVLVDAAFDLERDSGSLTKFRIGAEWVENSTYSLIIKPNAITDIYGHANDTFALNFTTQKEDYYARLLISFSSPVYPAIIQILDSKDVVIVSRQVFKSGKYEFGFLRAGRYSVRCVWDRNGNNKWDTGNYMQKLQPEQVINYKRPIELRSNWDVELTWDISD